MTDREMQRFISKSTGKPRKAPGWLWRLIIALGLGYAVVAYFVPWAQAQRGCANFGGEYILALAVGVLPFIVFRR